MDYFAITGGQPLHGELTLSGSKNLASKLMIASLLTSEPCQLRNVPDIGENQLATQLLTLAGASVRRSGKTLDINSSSLTTGDLRDAPRNRLPILIASPMLLRTGNVTIPEPGGDKIGKRPVDFHVAILRQLGATVTQTDGFYQIQADRLIGAPIDLPYPSVGATESALLAGVWADGTTTITGAAIEPEIMELVRFLQSLGGTIEYDNNRTFHITGTRQFHAASQEVISDRIEAVSYIALALASQGSLTLHRASEAQLDTYISFVKRLGASINQTDESLSVSWEKPLSSANITTGVHPGFMTDWQQPTTILLLTAEGESIVHETVHERRFGYVEQLNQMGADIRIEDTQESFGDPPFQLHKVTQRAHINGPKQLHGAELVMPDLRAGMAYIIAALIAQGESTVFGVDQVDRGYEAIESRLQSLGARIERRQQ